MSQDADHLLEADPTEQVLDAPTPSQPVVVIQYRSKAPSWFLVVALIFILQIGLILVYHRFVVDRLKAQAVQASREPASRLKKDGPDDRKPVATEPPAPLALNSQPTGTPRPALAPPPVAAPAAADSSAQGHATIIKEEPPRKPDTVPPSTVAGSLDTPPPDRLQPPPKPNPPITVAEPPSSSRSPFDDLDPPAVVADQPPLRSTVLNPAVIGESSSASKAAAAVPSGFLVAPTEGQPAGVPVRGASPAGAGPNRPVVSNDPIPLPSKEEINRTIREEAARKQSEIDVQLANQEAEIRSRNDEDRRRFRDEVREALRQLGKQAGLEIEKLCLRSGRVDDPVKKAQAQRIVSSPRLSQRAKVQQLRALGLPETFILDDYLANLIGKRLKTRDGPRDRNDVWYRAAQLLLQYDLPEPAPEPRRATPIDQSGRPANRPPSGGQLTGDVLARPR